MAYERQYTQGVGWENEPSINTPISAENLNQMDEAIQDVDAAVYTEFADVYNAIARAGGKVDSYHITSATAGTSEQAPRLIIIPSLGLHTNAILMLYSEINAEWSGQDDETWELYTSNAAYIGQIRDYREDNGALFLSTKYRGNIQAGSVLILSSIPNTTNWALRAIIPAAGGGGSSSLSGLSDVSLSSLIEGNVLRYRVSDGKWINSFENINEYENTQSGTISTISVSGLNFRNGNVVIIHFANDVQTSGQYWYVGGGMTPYPIKKQDGTYFSDNISAGTYLQLITNTSDSCFVLLSANSGGGGSSTLAGLTDTTITSPADKQILRYDNATSKWINGKNGANAFILNTGTTDHTGYTIDVDGSLATVEVGDIVEIQINANYTFEPSSGAVYLSRAWGLIASGWAANNVLQQVAVTEQYTDFKKNLKKGDSIFTVCTGFYGMNLWPQLLVVAMYNADGTALGDLNNVNISTPTDGQYLKYDSTSSKWVNASGGGGGGSSTLAGLDDTTISSPTAAQPLTYDATNSKWINGGVIPTANGGTGNADGYIRTGHKANTTIGTGATIEGYNNEASANYTHVEGSNNKASGNYSHAEGSSTQATGGNSHAEGNGSKATGGGSHAENTSNTASGNNSHAGGNNSTAGGTYSFVHGRDISIGTGGQYAAGFGQGTVANYNHQFVAGKYNNNKSTSIFEVGIGTGNNARSNGLELDTSGNLKTAGTITDGNGNVLGGGGSGNKVVKIDISGSSAVTGQYFNVTLSALPSISVGDILVLAIHCNHTFSGSTGAGWGLSITVDSSTTTWGSNLFRNYPEQTSSSSFFTSVFKDSFVPTGKVFTFVCTEISGTTPQFLMIAEENAQPEEQTVTLSTSSTTTVTFTRDDITTASVVEVGISEWGLVPDDVTVSSGSCTVTLPAVDSAHSVVVKLYVR